MPLTATQVKVVKPQSKTKKHYDSKGLDLQVTPNGGKWWRFKYRFNCREKLLSLGTYPEISLKKARERRDEQRRLVANKIDPSEHRKKTLQKAEFLFCFACYLVTKLGTTYLYSPLFNILTFRAIFNTGIAQGTTALRLSSVRSDFDAAGKYVA